MIKQIHIPDKFERGIYIHDHGSMCNYIVYPEQWLEIFYWLNPALKDSSRRRIWLSNVEKTDNDVIVLTVCTLIDTSDEFYIGLKKTLITGLELRTNKIFREITHRHLKNVMSNE